MAFPPIGSLCCYQPAPSGVEKSCWASIVNLRSDRRVPLCVLQLAVLQEEWKARSLSSQLMTGTELAESSTTDGFQHPRIRSEAAASPPVLDVGPVLKPFDLLCR